MKALVGILIIIGSILLYFWITGARSTVAPTTNDFQGPTSAPTVVGPQELPPQ